MLSVVDQHRICKNVEQSQYNGNSMHETETTDTDTTAEARTLPTAKMGY